MNGIAKHKKVIIFRLMILLAPTVNAYSPLDEGTIIYFNRSLVFGKRLFDVTNVVGCGQIFWHPIKSFLA